MKRKIHSERTHKMSWWPTRSRSADPGASAAPDIPMPSPPAGSNKAAMIAGVHSGAGARRSSEREAVSSLSRSGGGSNSNINSNGPEMQRRSPDSSKQRALEKENGATKNVNGRRGSTSGGTGGSGHAAQKVVQKRMDVGRVPLKTDTQSSSGVGSSRNSQNTAKSPATTKSPAKTPSSNPPPSADRLGTGMNVGGGWLDGLGSLVGLRPPVSIELPDSIKLKVIEADAVVKGQTATSSYKPAVLERNIKTMVPPFIEVGNEIVISTEDSTYIANA